jgi:hypothetical protein
LKTTELCGFGLTASTLDSANKTTPFANQPRITQALLFLKAAVATVSFLEIKVPPIRLARIAR